MARLETVIVLPVDRGRDNSKMKDPATAGEEQQFKQRAMRRLAFALVLIAAAIVTLTIVDHDSAKRRPATQSPQPPPEFVSPQPLTPATGLASSQQGDASALPPPPPDVDEEPVTPRERLAVAPAPSAKPSGSPASTLGAPPKQPGPAHPQDHVTAPAHGESIMGTGFTVQLGVFTSMENAQALYAKLKEQGIPAFLETRVVVGPFRDRLEADAAQRKLTALGISGVIVQRK